MRRRAGPGDDAAIVRASDGRVVASTDLLIENRHFRRDWSSANDIGHKAAAKNFADIVAIGAVPTALLVGFGTPGELEVEWVDGFTAGLREECGVVGAVVVGGDIVASDSITIAITALGDLQGRDPVTLDGARVGDVVAFAGRLGWAGAGLAVLGRGFRSPVQVVNAHRRPEPPYAQGVEAALIGASAMTDVSDGLVADLGNIAAASNVRIDLSAKLLPVPLKLKEVAAALNTDPMSWVLTERRRLRAGGDLRRRARAATRLDGHRGRERGFRVRVDGRVGPAAATSTSADAALPPTARGSRAVEPTSG